MSESQKTHRKPVPFTIAQALLLIFLLAMGFGAIVNVYQNSTIFIATLFFLIVGLSVHAMRRQYPFSEFARGFLLCFLLYFAVVAAFPKSSLNPEKNWWPIPVLAEKLWQEIVKPKWIQQANEEVLAKPDPRRELDFFLSHFQLEVYALSNQVPDNQWVLAYMLSLHLILATIIAFILGRYAILLARTILSKFRITCIRPWHPWLDCLAPFLFTILLYFSIVAAMGCRAWDPLESWWPGTWLSRTLFEAIVDREWIDPKTGEILRDLDLEAETFVFIGDFARIRTIDLNERPGRPTFMKTLHLTLAIFLGVIAAIYARWLAYASSKSRFV